MIGNLMTYTEPLRYRLTLLKPTYKEMSVLQEAYNIKYKGSLRDMNELSFSLPYYINEEINPNFSKVKNGYLIYVELYSEENDTVFLKEYFLIDRIENHANDKEVKNVSCLGLEQQLSKKLLKNYTGVKKLYRTPVEIAAYTSSELYPTKQDFINSGILNVITNLCPSWSVGEVDDDINELYRDVMVDSDSVLSFLRNTVQTSFSCLFYFDSIKKEIHVRNLTHLGVNRGFFISENNYIKSLKETIDDSDIVTKLNIYGKDELSIRSVNPTGETYILDLSYYRNTDYMSQSLLDALDHYDTLMVSKSEAFKNLLIDLNTYTTQLNTKNSELTTLKGDLEALETQRDGLIAANNDLYAISKLIVKKKTDIENVENEINNLQTNLDQVTQQIEDLQTFILIENNFTPEQIEELDYYIKEKTVRDSTFTHAQELYDEGKAIIKRLSQPSVQFDIDIVDLFDLVECQHDWYKVTLGDIGTIKFEKFNRDVELRLIEYTHNFEDNKLSLTFGNRKNLNDPNMLIDDLKSSVSSSVSLDINKYKYLDYINSGDKSAIHQYINGLLDLGAQGAVAGSNQEVKIDARGITLTNPSKPNQQVRLMADGIYFTLDGWQTSKIALTSENGIAAEVIRGILGEFSTVRADKIIVGDAGQKISDDVISSSDVWNNIESNANSYTDSVASDLQNQIDGNITTWFYDGEPTLLNSPAINWTTDTEKDKHLGDLYYDNLTGYAYRFRKNVSIYEWIKIEDTDITTALTNAKNAQDTADGKRRVFTATPTPPYDVGDLWAGGANGDLKRCKQSKELEDIYSAGDWELASKYTDDTLANEALNKANNSVQQGTL
ncbi:MAG: phage tail protein, partial [Clostridia bacterium]|nr:phage tail protein [Clostridia bacterium]